MFSLTLLDPASYKSNSCFTTGRNSNLTYFFQICCIQACVKTFLLFFQMEECIQMGDENGKDMNNSSPCDFNVKIKIHDGRNVMG